VDLLPAIILRLTYMLSVRLVVPSFITPFLSPDVPI
jgi:hypothetical protein